MGKHRITLAVAALLLTCLCCDVNALLPTDPTATPLPLPKPTELEFTDPETGERFLALAHCIPEWVDGDEWVYLPYETIGNFYRARWCRGLDERCILASGNADVRGQQIVELDTHFYPNAFPETFGLGLRARYVPEDQGWGASFWFSEESTGIVGEGWSVGFPYYSSSSGSPDFSLRDGHTFAYEVFETRVWWTSDLSPREDLALSLASAEALRDRALLKLGALEERVRALIESHGATTCDYGEPDRSNLPPICTPRPLSPEEEAAALAEAEVYFEEQRALWNEHYEEVYAVWFRTFPFDTCWP
jgi:hypothetical protein